MVNDVIADPLAVANELRPVLLRLAAPAAQGDRAARGHEPAGDTPLADPRQPGPEPARAGRRGGNLGARALRPRRPAREGGADRAGAGRGRSPPRRAVADRRRASDCSSACAPGARPGWPTACAGSTTTRSRRSRRDRAARKASVTAALLALNARTFASLKRHRNYRLFFTGQVISVSGTWMQNVALAWLVVELTHSPLAVGILAFCRFIPFTVFGLVAGRRRRPDRQPQARDRNADRLDDLLGALRGVRAQRPRDALGRLRARDPLQHRARLRRARPARAHLPDGRTRRAAERGRAQREPLQRLAGRRPRRRRRPDRRLRRRRLLRDQRRHLPRRARRAADDAEGRAGAAPAKRRAADDDARHPRGLRLGAGCARACGSSSRSSRS